MATIQLIKDIYDFDRPKIVGIDEATKMISKHGSCLERYDAETIVCPFWDLEHKTSEPLTDRLVDEHRIIAVDVCGDIIDAIIKFGGIPNDPSLKHLVVCSDCREVDGETKLSFHLVATYLKTNIKSMPILMAAADELARQKDEHGLPLSSYVDMSVYPVRGSHLPRFKRAFRCVNQDKSFQGSLSRLKMFNGSLDQHLIQNTSYAKHEVFAPEDRLQEFYMRREVIDEISKESDITGTELEQLCSLMPPCMVRQYPDWKVVVFATVNEGKRLNMKRAGVLRLVHMISQKAPEVYNEEKVTKAFDKIWKNASGGSTAGTLVYHICQTQTGREAVAKMRAAREPCLFDIKDVTDDAPCDDQFLKVFDDPSATIDQRVDAILNMPKVACKFPYDIVKREFERVHFKIYKGGYGYLTTEGTVDTVNAKQLEERYENLKYKKSTLVGDQVKSVEKRFIRDGWLEDPLVKTYMSVDFLPPPQQVPVGTYNLYRGMPIQAKRPMRMVDSEDWESVREKCQRAFQLFNEHLSILVNHNDDDKDYLMTFVAHILQRPGEKVARAHVFRSKPGCGKGTLAELLESLLGMYYQYTQGLDGITQQFNASLVAQKLVIIVDEVEIMEHVKVEQKLKSLISEKTAKVEKKYMDAFNIRNMCRIFIFSNEMNPIKITSDDRRYGVFDCSDDKINDADFWDELHALYGDVDVQRYIFDQLMEVDVTKYNFNTPSSIPITRARQELIGHNLAWIDRFVGKMVLDKSAQIKDGVLTITSGKMCELANDADYCKSIGVAPLTRMMNPSAFGKRVKDVKGVTTAPPRDGYARYAVHAETIWKWLAENGDESVPMFQ